MRDIVLHFLLLVLFLRGRCGKMEVRVSSVWTVLSLTIMGQSEEAQGRIEKTIWVFTSLAFVGLTGIAEMTLCCYSVWFNQATAKT
jgi:hypothetical protein